MGGPAAVAAALGSKRGSPSYLENLEIFRKWFDTPVLQLAGKLGRRIQERLAARRPPATVLVASRRRPCDVCVGGFMTYALLAHRFR